MAHADAGANIVKPSAFTINDPKPLNKLFSRQCFSALKTQHLYRTQIMPYRAVCNSSNGFNNKPNSVGIISIRSIDPASTRVQHCSYTGACNHVEQNVIHQRRYGIRELVSIGSECKPTYYARRIRFLYVTDSIQRKQRRFEQNQPNNMQLAETARTVTSHHAKVRVPQGSKSQRRLPMVHTLLIKR